MAGNQATSTTTPGMQASAGYLATTQGVAQNGMATVADALGALKSTWTGDASMVFDSAMRAWMDDCQFISKKLGEMIEIMNGNRRTIVAGEQSNVDQAHQIQVGPGLAGL